MGDSVPKCGSELLASLAALDNDLKPETESASKYRELIADAEKHLGKATAKYDERVKARRGLTKRLVSLSKEGKLTLEEAAAAKSALATLSSTLTEIESLRPATGSIFVRAFLGQVNVRASTTKDRAKLRDEYNKFKDRTNLGFIVFPLVWIFVYMYLRHTWRYTHWIHILTHIWMLYYYVSLSLRENILRVNGSNIKNWWIIHHYLSSVMSITVLTWPADSVSWDYMTPHLTAYFAYQGLVQVFQARYQKARHYARMAMGKAAHMDVAHTETLTEWHRGLAFITVLVFIAQLWQLALGYTMLFRLLPKQLNPSQPWYDFREEVQCVIVGGLFLLLGVVNCGVTIQTLVEKRRQNLRAAAEQQRAALADPPGERTSLLSGSGTGSNGNLSAAGVPAPLRASSAYAIPSALSTPVAPPATRPGPLQIHSARSGSGLNGAGQGGSTTPVGLPVSGRLGSGGGPGANNDSPLFDGTLIASSGSSSSLNQAMAQLAMEQAAAAAAAAGGSSSARGRVPSLPIGTSSANGKTADATLRIDSSESRDQHIYRGSSDDDGGSEAAHGGGGALELDNLSEDIGPSLSARLGADEDADGSISGPSREDVALDT